jgi:hypothetical protein
MVSIIGERRGICEEIDLAYQNIPTKLVGIYLEKMREITHRIWKLYVVPLQRFELNTF